MDKEKEIKAEYWKDRYNNISDENNQGLWEYQKKLSSKKQKKMNNLLIKNQLVPIEWKLK